MADRLEYERQIVRLGRRLHDHLNALEQVRDLLEKADARRKTAGPDQQHHWNKMLDELEKQLDVLKAVTTREAEMMRQLGRKVEQMAQGEQVEDIPFPASEEMDGNGSDEVDTAILGIPRHRASELTVDEFAALYQRRNRQAEAANGSGQPVAPVQSRQSLYKRKSSSVGERSTILGPGASLHPAIKGIVNKIAAHKTGELTPEEILIVRATNAQLANKKNLNPQDHRIKTILMAAARIIDRASGDGEG